MKKLLMLSFPVSLFLFSCGPKINEDQQAKLNELSESVDSIIVAVNGLDSAELFKMTTDFFEKKEFLQQKMSDTLKPELIFKIDEFIQLRKAMNFVASEYSPIKAEAKITENQVKDLKQDVDNRLIDEKKFNTYYELEQKNFSQLKFATDRLVDISKQAKEGYEEKTPLVDSLITAYKAKTNE